MPTEPIPVEVNPYTAQRPLVVTDHPFRANRSMLVTAAIVLVFSAIYIVVRAVRGSTPLFNGGTIFVLCLGMGIAVVLVWFARRLSSGVRVTVTDSDVRRELRRGGEDADRVVEISAIRLGLLASRVRYARKHTGAELILFAEDDRILWLADGLEPRDLHTVAHALSVRGIRHHAAAITNDQLRVIVRKLRRELSASADDGEPPSDRPRS